MKIRWYGGNCIVIKGKQARIILGWPYKTGIKPDIRAGDLVILPYPLNVYSEDDNKIFTTNQAFVVDSPGEYSYQGVTIQAQAVKSEQGDVMTVVSLSVDGVVVASLMDLDRELQGKELEIFSRTDILVLPVGGGGVLGHKVAARLANQIEPRVILPIHSYTTQTPDKEPVEVFLKEYGSSVETVEELSMKKTELPFDRTEVITLSVTEK